jgi:hypothetical protein
MSEHNHLNWFTTNGSTTLQGQRNAGAWEAKNCSQPAPQQAHERADAYQARVNSYNNSKSGS